MGVEAEHSPSQNNRLEPTMGRMRMRRRRMTTMSAVANGTGKKKCRSRGGPIGLNWTFTGDWSSVLIGAHQLMKWVLLSPDPSSCLHVRNPSQLPPPSSPPRTHHSHWHCHCRSLANCPRGWRERVPLPVPVPWHHVIRRGALNNGNEGIGNA